EVPLLTEPEIAAVLREWSAVAVAPAARRPVHQLFEAQVERTPEASALVFGEQHWSFRELNRQANRLAHHLRAMGVGPEVRVGICTERSGRMIEAVLAVLKAGGAYVPLDPSYPRERLALMLDDADIAVLLVQEGLLPGLPDRAVRTVLLGSPLSGEAADNPRGGAEAASPAYLTYTSGSTGRPKGITMVHQALSNLVEWQCGEPALQRGVRRLQFASLSFDASFRETFSTLCSSGTLVLVSEEIQRDVQRLARFVVDQGIDKLLLPAVVLHRLLEEMLAFPAASLPLLELITAGEQLRITPLITQFFEKFGGCSFHNHYGPSESHMVMTFPLEDPPSAWPALPPVGRPIVNAEVYLLDGRMQPVPLGVSGEVYIGGICLARGYFGRSDLTADRFVPHPFAAQPGARLYRTGDLARHRRDGNLEFLGRNDHQVKVRGFRIELGEIDAVLSSHPGVREVLTLAIEQRPGERYLVSYVAPKGDDVKGLRSFLKERLPEYMVPASFV
ncbi:MAG TPA: amino acid adenylation domain-containing protein, partial [Thermoanaerobaculia bacterium]|nr:amino acid adenylation domain-containing protein [Thermoanaerobaculia bacterium]